MQNTQTQRREEQIALRAEFLKVRAYINRACQHITHRDDLLRVISAALRAA